MFRILKSDITKLRDVEIIVNAANGCGIMGEKKDILKFYTIIME